MHGDAQILCTANLPQDSAVDGVVTVYLPPPASNYVSPHIYSGWTASASQLTTFVDDPDFVAE